MNALKQVMDAEEEARKKAEEEVRRKTESEQDEQPPSRPIDSTNAHNTDGVDAATDKPRQGRTETKGPAGSDQP